MVAMLTVGDTVLWRGSWGNDAPRTAVVTAIERTEDAHAKYGADVDAIAWYHVRLGYAVVSLDNGHWAYGSQLEPVLDKR